MSKRLTHVEKAIAAIEEDIRALELAREHLRAQLQAQAPKPTKQTRLAAVSDG